MKIKKYLLILLLPFTVQCTVSAQSEKGSGRSFGGSFIIDSTSTMLIPYRYDVGLFTSNKTLTWGNYFANMIVYDFENDSYNKLFAEDTYIRSPETSYDDGYGDYSYSVSQRSRYPYLSAKWVFYLVRNADYNRSGKVDDKDPQVLYVTDRKGKGLRPLTSPDESVLGMTLFEPQGFALLRIQRDKDKDLNFKPEDDDHYLVRLDLSDLRLGKPIEFKAVP